MTDDHSNPESPGGRKFSKRQRREFLKSLKREVAWARGDSRQFRGFVAAVIVFLVISAGEFLAFWKLGGFDAGTQASSSAFRGLGYLMLAQLAVVGWVYRRFSRR